MFAGSDRGGERAAAMYSLIATAKLNDVDPRAWLADVLARIADHPASRLHELLPWNWKAAQASARRRGRLTVAAPSVVFTIARAAEMLGETVDLLDEIAEQLEPEDGCLWIYDTDDRATLGFTERGIESLKELIARSEAVTVRPTTALSTRGLGRMDTIGELLDAVSQTAVQVGSVEDRRLLAE